MEHKDFGDGVAVKWGEANEELVKLLSYTLRMILPDEHAKGPGAGDMRRKKKELELQFQGWCGIALNK